MTRLEDPTDHVERRCFAEGARHVAGIDEVGRGAWAGPVSVGIAVFDLDALGNLPTGVRDSKMLSPKRREELFPILREAVSAYAVGHASAAECDRLGMTGAQRLATTRALAELPFAPDVCILDGSVNFSGRPDAIVTPGADRRIVVVAAASILAKVTRDRLMIAQHERFPEYEFASNKGYPSPTHIAALGRFGLTQIHRASWSFAPHFASRHP